MLRKVVVALSVVSVLGAVSVAQAGAAPGPVQHSKRVCTDPVAGSGRVACMARVLTDARGRAMKVNPNVSGYGPSQFHSAYNLPLTVAGKHTIAIIDAFSQPNIFNDLNVYNAQFGLPAMKKCTKAKQTNCIAILNQNGQTSPLPPPNSGWGLEISLDVEVAHAICQNCRINLYEANDNSFPSLKTAVNTAAATKRVVAISNSYGGPGACGPQAAYNHPNIAITVSSGDSGFGVACPASLNTVIAVGGTTLLLNGSGGYLSESTWSGTGSGCSKKTSAQPWQRSASNWATIGCRSKRGVTDVSADANPSTGAAVYDSYGAGGWVQVGGTSLSAPLIAGVYALANNAGTWAYPAESVYDSPGSLHDVTTGSNGTCAPHLLQCSAGVGYDLPTGIGTPNGLGGF